MHPQPSTTNKLLIFFFAWTCILRPFALCSTFTITNNCQHAIWPGTLAGSGTSQLPSTGFRLDPGRSARLPAPPGWSGRIWARTGCAFDASGAGTCETGDCGGRIQCAGAGAIPPATLFEVTLGQGADQDYYDVSLVDGYNLPIIVAPMTARGGCNQTGCAADINIECPKELQVDGGGGGGVVACKSACEAFGSDQYCCSGEFANPSSCKPSSYSSFFKTACPRAYSYAFDDGTSTFTCKAFDYTIVFCPTLNGMRRSHGPTAGQPPIQSLSIGQPANQNSDQQQQDPVEITSSANIESFHLSLLLLCIFFL